MNNIDDNIFYLEMYRNKNFRFVASAVWVDWSKDKKGKTIKKQFCMICIKDNETGAEVVHPICDFILKNYGLKAYNTQKKHAYSIVKFLNYLINDNVVSTLKALTIQDGITYLNSLKVSKSTVKDIERSLNLFYIFLIQIGCIENLNPGIIQENINKQGRYYYESVFYDVIYPSHQKTDREHMFPEKYIPLLLEVAILIANPIALGIYLQIFGGLRVGELVNIKRSAFRRKVESGDFIIDLKNQMMRTDIKDLSGSSNVKVPRKQKIYQINNWLDEMFYDHIEIYKPTDGSGALFVNRDGRAMSGKSYSQYFTKVKNKVIEFLESGSAEDRIVAKHLKNSNWSTHIGRGTFTNLIATFAENPLQIAFPRGDKNLTTSLIYMSKTERIRKKIEERIGNMHIDYIPRLIERDEKK